MTNTNREFFKSILDAIELEIRENHPNISTDKDKYAVGVNNGLQLAKAIIYKHRDSFVLCADCAYYKRSVCIRKVKAGGSRAVDKVRSNDWCSYGKRREENVSQ